MLPVEKANWLSFKATVVPMIGITDFKITDVESETNQRLDERMVTQFVGLNARAGKKQIVNEADTPFAIS